MPDTINAALLIIRLMLGVVFLAHGIKHAMGRVKTTNWFASLGFKQAGMQWFASTATEIGVGILLTVGLLTSFAAAGVIGIMFVAFWTVHRSAGFFITSFMKEGIDVEGYEYVMTLAVAALAIAVGGPGDWSIDEQIIIDGTSLAAQLDGGVGALIAGLGLLAGVVLLAVFWRPAEAS
jgi:putative oxidoreductase